MIATSVNKLTGQVIIYTGVKSYQELYNPAFKKWFYVLVTEKNTIMLEQKMYRISLEELK